MRLTIRRVISVLLVVWIVFAGAAHFMVFRELKQVVQLVRSGEVDLVEDRTHRVGEWLAIARFTSMGMSRVMPLSPIYDVTDDLVKTLKTGLDIYRKSTEMLSKSLSGIELSGQEIEEWQVGMDELMVYQVNLINSVNEFDVSWVGSRLVGEDVRGELETMTRLVNENNSLIKVVVDGLPILMGMESRQSYVVLLQNNMELRPTGGFMGSYALVEFDRGAMVNLEIQDIYEPDGRIAGYVEEPMPIREYLFDGEHPGWRLRDSNWDPHFPQAAKEISWFFNEGGISNLTGMASMTLWPVKDLLKITGPIAMPDYGIEVDHDNLYQYAQYFAEHEFFPGSTQKRDFLGAMGRRLLWDLIDNHNDYLAELAPLIWKHLNERQLQVYIFNDSPTGIDLDIKTDLSQLSSELSDRGWDGAQLDVECRLFNDCISDYLMLVEANVGINKANCCVDRLVNHKIDLTDEGAISHKLEIEYINNNPSTPLPPIMWGGGYKNYIRLFVPVDAELVGIWHDGVEVEESLIAIDRIRDKQVFGWLSLVPGGSSQLVVVEYVVPIQKQNHVYELVLQKQSGIDEVDWSIELADGLSASQHRSPYTLKPMPLDALRRDVLFVIR